MAKLPTYDSRVDLTTETGVARKSMEVAAQTGQNISGLGKAVSSVQKTWQEAKDFSETLSSKNRFLEEANDIAKRAKVDPDPENDQIYRDELQKARDRSLEGFSNNLARMEWQSQADNLALQENIKLDDTFWSKQIDKTRGDLAKSKEANKQEYLNTGDDHYPVEYLNDVEIARRRGFISQEDYDKATIEVKSDWSKGRILRIAETDWETAMRIVDDDNKLSAEEKSAMKSNIKTIHEQEKIKREIKLADYQQQSIEDVRTVISDPQYSYVAKLDAIQRSGLDTEDKNTLERYLNSADRINATSYDSSLRETLVLIGNLQSGITEKSKGKDLKTYLTKIKDVRKYILDQRAAGRLTQADEDTLTEELNKAIRPEETKAINKLVKEGSWGIGNFGYNDANKYFETLFNKNATFTDASMREYFNRVLGKKLKGGELKAIAGEVYNYIVQKNRIDIADQLTGKKMETTKIQLNDAEVLRYFDASEADIEYTMKANNMTREAVVQSLRDKL